jgi:phosphopantothenoylcysteine decarboxylase / phosphopantothenate---cysteine ligase
LKILLSAGPTLEPIDSVRFISNRSSGRMGVAIAESALKRGHQVTVVHGKLEVSHPTEGKWLPIESTQELLDTMLENINDHDVVIMAAAVCDMRLKIKSKGKIDKKSLRNLELEPTPDVAYELSKANSNIFKVAFSLEEEINIERSMSKLVKKSADWIVCNELPSMGSNSSHFFMLNGEGEKIINDIVCSKAEFAESLISALENLKR